jgi:formate dehydrogenase subunit gamma
MHRNSVLRCTARFLPCLRLFALALFALAVPLAASGADQPATPGLQQGAADVPRAAEGQSAQVQRQQTQPQNNAPVWRDIRSGDINAYQTTQVRGIETAILVQTEGEIWRRIRNGPITVYGGWLIVLAFLALGLFYWRKGEIKLHEPKTGRVIVRFTPWERLVHWATAISFVILAVSGIIMLFGRYVVLPATGYTIFSTLAIIAKNLHNFVGPLFIVCAVLIFFTFVRDNMWRAYDWNWMRKFGGLLSGEHVPSGRFNAAEKLWFWFGVLVLGLIVGASGLVLDFPNFGQGRETMQIANVIHAIAAVIFMAASLGHIYIGTIGMEGAYDSMRHGTVDETWAKEHHEYWYQQEMAARGRAAPGMAAPKAAPAASMKEGWKL